MRMVLLVLAVLLGGCARYEYDVVSPQMSAGHVGSQEDYVFARDPLEYRLRTVDNRLVMRIYNITETPITLAGEESSVVDPEGQSHPLRTQTIAPDSFIKLIIPPPRPTYDTLGPSVGVGMSAVGGVRWDDRFDPLISSYDFDEPRYMTVYDQANTFYWDWDGESEVRLLLAFQRGDEFFTQDFVVRRAKLK